MAHLKITNGRTPTRTNSVYACHPELLLSINILRSNTTTDFYLLPQTTANLICADQLKKNPVMGEDELEQVSGGLGKEAVSEGLGTTSKNLGSMGGKLAGGLGKLGS